jgi:trans-aconitate 2-methyltransferase
MSSKGKDEVAAYYDAYVVRQIRTAYNERQLNLVEELKSLGLKSNSNVLEIGCGVGVISSLLAEIISKGKIVSLDISAASIRVARELNRDSRNVEFLTGDVMALTRLEVRKFDFILLFDVLEHIPIAEHSANIEVVRSIAQSGTMVVVNIPSPQYNRYLREYEKESLQVIDEIVETNLLVEKFYRFDFVLHSFRTYAMWVEDQYQLMVFKIRTPFANKKVAAVRPGISPIRALRRRLNLRRIVRVTSPRM